MELFELIQTLNTAHGPSGDDGAVREVIAALACLRQAVRCVFASFSSRRMSLCSGNALLIGGRISVMKTSQLRVSPS